MKRVLALVLCLLPLLCGCRARTGIGGPDSAERGGPVSATDGQPNGSLSDDPGVSVQEPEAAGGENLGEAGDLTRENPAASRKEYDESGAVEIMPGTDRALHGNGEGDGLAAADEKAGRSASQLSEGAAETALQTVPVQEADRLGIAEDAAPAESAMTYYTVLLRERMGSLFECRRLNAYWETDRDHVTIHRSSEEHALILRAGLYDVSARLLSENLLVDDGWVVRKNPGVIIKMVDSSVLGRGVSGTGAAAAADAAIRSRSGWQAIDAVQNGRVLLLSRELLETPWQQTAAMLLIAATANPELFQDVNPDEALRMLSEEAAGAPPAGRYYYRGED